MQRGKVKLPQFKIHRSILIYAFCVLFVMGCACVSIRSQNVYRITSNDFQTAEQSNDGLFGTGGDEYGLRTGSYTVQVQFSKPVDGYYQVVDINNNEILATGYFFEDSEKDGAGYYVAASEFSCNDRIQHIQIQVYCDEDPEIGQTYYFGSKPIMDFVAVPLIIGVLAAWLYFCWKHDKTAGNHYLLMISIISIIAASPFFTENLQFGHDVGFHLSRITGIGCGLQDGQFPVRLNTAVSEGAGSIVDIMYPELFLYLPGAMYALGTSSILAYKTLCIFVTIATGLIAYYAGSQVVSKRTAFIFALIYLFCPYRMNDIFIRAAMGEALALAFMPLALVGVWQLLKGNYKKGYWISVIGVTCVFQSHLISTIILAILAIIGFLITIVFSRKTFFSDLKRLKAIILAVISVILLNLWFIVPMLHYYGWNLKISALQNGLAYAAIAPWQAFMDSYNCNYEHVTTSTTSEMPLSIGFVLLIGILLYVYTVYILKDKIDASAKKIGTASLAISIVALFMTTFYFPWNVAESIPVLLNSICKIQFPWRLLMIPAIGLSLVTAIAVDHSISNKKQYYATGIITCSILLGVQCMTGYLDTNISYIKDSTTSYATASATDDFYYLSGDSVNCDEDGTCVRASKNILAEVRQGISYYNPEVTIDNYHKSGDHMTFSFSKYGKTDSVNIIVPFYGYDLFQATLLSNGTVLSTSMDPETHLLSVTIPEGVASDSITVKYHEPFSFRCSELVSVLFLLTLIIAAQRKAGMTAVRS